MILFLFSFVQMRRIIADKEILNLESYLYQSVATMDSKLEVYDNLSDYIAFDRKLEDVFSTTYEHPYEQYEQVTEVIDPVLQSLKYFHSEIRTITIYTDSGIVKHDTTVGTISEIENEDWYRDIRESEGVKWYVDREKPSIFSARKMPVETESGQADVLRIEVDYEDIFAPYEQTLTTEYGVFITDENGDVITPQYTTMDADTAEISLNVLQVRELPLVVDFIGLPAGFDTSSLSYTLDRQTMRVAGPARTISTLTELSVASLDLGQNFAFDRDYQLNVELPDGIVSQDGVNTVTLTFDTSGMDTTTLNISNIRVINVPSDVNVEVLSSLVSNVQLYGPAEEIATLGADSIVAVVDCQSISVTTGQQTLPVSIQIPSSSRIFAVGSYTVQCEITTQ